MMLLALAGAARADESAETRRLVEIAADAYKHGFYNDALQAYQDAYRRSPRPIFLVDMAQCFERLEQNAEAAAAYRQYVALEPHAKDRARIEQRAAELEQRAPRAAAPPPPAIVIHALPPPVAAPDFAARVATLKRGELGAAFGTGLAGVLASALTIGAATSYSYYAHSCRLGDGGCTPDAATRLQRLDYAADAMWAVTAAGAVTTLTLHLLGRRARLAARPSLAMAPGAVAAALSFAF